MTSLSLHDQIHLSGEWQQRYREENGMWWVPSFCSSVSWVAKSPGEKSSRAQQGKHPSDLSDTGKNMWQGVSFLSRELSHPGGRCPHAHGLHIWLCSYPLLSWVANIAGVDVIIFSPFLPHLSLTYIHVHTCMCIHTETDRQLVEISYFRMVSG